MNWVDVAARKISVPFLWFGVHGHAGAQVAECTTYALQGHKAVGPPSIHKHEFCV